MAMDLQGKLHEKNTDSTTLFSGRKKLLRTYSRLFQHLCPTSELFRMWL